jgi:Glu-tRNA(Gln) amidotransferase subunit E-like FAD-binding protein
MTNLANATIDEIYAELRKRECAVVIVQPDTLADLIHRYDAEEIAWSAIESALERAQDNIDETE